MAGATDSELHALQMENARLRAALAARVQENETLLQMIGDVVSTLKLERVLHQIVVHLESSFNCNAVFVYLIERERTRLVMRAASERYGSSVGRISMSMDEGLAGWSARTGEPAMIPEAATADPRFRYFAELEEERFQAMLTVPICGPDSTVVAVIAMHTVAPQEFTTDHVRIVAAMAPILGSAIESSRLYEQTSRKLGVLSILSTLGQEVRSGRSLEDALAALVATIGQATGADRCALLLLEPGADQISARVYTMAGGAVDRFRATSIERRPWDDLVLILEGNLDGNREDAANLEMLETGTGRTVIPLVVAGEQLGLLCCSRDGIRLGGDELPLLQIIAAQSAIAVKNSQLADLLTVRDVPARLFRDLMDGTDEGDDVVKRRAALLGCDLGRPHAPVVLSLAVDSSPAARRAALLRVLPLAQRWLSEKFPGSLIHLEAELWLVVRVRGEAPLEPLLSELSALHGLLVRELGGLTCVGVGRICRALIDYRQGFEQAQEALRVARSTRAPDGVAAFDRLGAARYLAGLAAESPTETPQDRFQQAIEELCTHDARRASGLLETLTAFLAAGGNIARTAERLYVHRNTLVQRLDKIQDLTGLDPRESDHWLALQIVLTLRQLQREG